MKKRIAAMFCALAISASLMMPGVQAMVSNDEVLPVLAAMGVLNGDAKGDLHLDENVTRAAFTKMAVAASTYKDMATSSAHVSPFADVKYNHWAAGYVKTGVDAGWVNGYLDGTFRPNHHVKLEEAVNICLKMLGYTDADFATGTFPYPQLALYENEKMDKGIKTKRGENLTREECAQLIYNTLNATTKDGKVYALTLGYTIDASGNIDYLSVINAELEGPVIMDSGTLESKVGFKPAAVYRNDRDSSAASVIKNDVVYYMPKTKTVWAYHNRVTGIYESAVPNRSNPTGIVVSGASYEFETSSAAYAVSATGEFKLGDPITLLLGRNNTVAAVITPDEAGGMLAGVVLGTGTGNYVDAQGKAYTAPYIKILGADGVTYQHQTDKIGYYNEGDLVKVSLDNGEVEISRISSPSKELSGTVNKKATTLGEYQFADDVKILDYADETVITVAANRLSGVQIEERDIAYYELNDKGEIGTLILKNVTGDMYSFGVLIEDEEITGSNGQQSHIYTIQSGGAQAGPFACEHSTFAADEGKAVRYRADETGIKKIENLIRINLASVDGNAVLTKDHEKFQVNYGVQVYIAKWIDGKGVQYYVSSLDQINDGKYTLTGWYDQKESSGGRMRVIIAQEN